MENDGNTSGLSTFPEASSFLACHRRFEDACKMIQNNAAKFLDEEESESSSSEDDAVNDLDVQKTWKHYDDNENKNLQKVKDYLQDLITRGAITCLICIESVSKKDKIWNCESCYCLLHLNCIRKWAKDSLYSSSSDLDRSLKWSCPQCRFDYLPSDQPSKYFCFCKKVENPLFDSWTVPHSCGNICEKRLNPDCGHFCSLLCHPGPCPPCPKTISITCCCLKSKAVSKRCSDKEWICGKKCKKVLYCKSHCCEERCHKGLCPPCKMTKIQSCDCGAESELRPCADPYWNCKKICNKPLECQHHNCQLVCHRPGMCLPCTKVGATYCPCGKLKRNVDCYETPDPCGDTCNKLLTCGIHRCSQRCHWGPCEECIQMRVQRCRCGMQKKSVPCSKQYICDIKCKKLRDCRRHNCNRKCCSGDCPPCEVSCGKTLKCGRHKCPSLCHTGPCFPCKEKQKIQCRCGHSKVKIPCGGKKQSAPPKCPLDCKLPSDCHHPKREKHKCHYGNCPPCRLTCNTVLQCGHKCPDKCHSAVITKVQTKEKITVPWDVPKANILEVVANPCPPCLSLIEVECLGGHEKTFIPCSDAKSVTCGKLCGRAMLCGNHSCKLECHEVKDRTNFEVSENCESCTEICQKPRKEGCTHPCLRPCHPGQCSPCKQNLKMKCHCQMTLLHVICDEWCSSNEDERINKSCCLNRCPKQMSCGHRCILTCHSGKCADRENCKKKVIFRCPCKRRKKESPCHSLAGRDLNLECDKECYDYQILSKEIEMKKAKEIEVEKLRQQEKELKEFLKKTDGKKKRKKKQTEVLENNGRFSFIKLGALVVVVAIVAVTICFFK